MSTHHPLHVVPTSVLPRTVQQVEAHGPARPRGRESDFRIIGEHLRKASQSNNLATRLHAQGLSEDAEQQNRLTHVFLQNALCRIKPSITKG
jgi:hypothetical protein